MKLYKRCVFLFLLFLVLSCREEKDSSSSNSVKIPAINQTKTDYKSLLDSLVILQSQIMIDPENKRLQQKLLLISFDTTNGCFLTAGMGISPSDQNKTNNKQLRLRAAKMIAQRWALYLKTWRNGNIMRFGTSISGTITYDSECYSEMRHDTLYIILQIPLGSINM